MAHTQHTKLFINSRPLYSGWATETEYVIRVSASPILTPFKIVKTYADFRRLTKTVLELNDSEEVVDNTASLCYSAIASQPARYISKSCFWIRKNNQEEQERAQLVQSVLTALCQNHTSSVWHSSFARFLLSDVVIEDDERTADLSVDTTTVGPDAVKVVPLSCRRLSATPSISSSIQKHHYCDSHWKFLLLFAAGILVMRFAGDYRLRVDGDLAVVLVLIAYNLGRLAGRENLEGWISMIDERRTSRPDLSMVSPLSSTSSAQNTGATRKQQQLALFPTNATLGSNPHCWSVPEASDFLVRGPSYQSDRVKVPSQNYLACCRGVELFLTNEDYPDSLINHPSLLCGHLHDTPSLIVHCRLAWGVLLMYGSIPAHFVPYLNHQEANDNDIDCETLTNRDPNLTTPAQRLFAQWLGCRDNDQRNRHLKILPAVVEGPWVVQTVVGGKPALIGTKLPVRYYRQNNCLEIVLDITSSAAARSILGVARQYTTALTMHLGFVLEDATDECMLLAAGLHNIDPSLAPDL